MTETITWHSYPEEKPDKAGAYIIHSTREGIIPAYWSNNKKKRRFTGFRMRVNETTIGVLWNVIEWTEMPKGSK